MEDKITKDHNAKGVVLLSGGMDSCAIAAEAIAYGYELAALTFDYGQLHRKEVEKASLIAREMVIPHRIAELKFVKQLFGNKSTLLSGKVEAYKPLAEGEVATSYVPLRNTIFLSIAAGLAETIEADNIFIGANFVDYGGYPDCRKGYLEQVRHALMLGSERWTTGGHVLKIHHHENRTKEQIVIAGIANHAPFEHTWSCYKGLERPCLHCDSCHNRTKGFMYAGVPDPALTEDEWARAVQLYEGSR